MVSLLAAVILLTRTCMAHQVLHAVRNVPRVKQGRIAFLHVEPTDLLTYDLLRVWRHELTIGPPLGAAGQSLIILTALPAGTEYNSEHEAYAKVSCR